MVSGIPYGAPVLPDLYSYYKLIKEAKDEVSNNSSKQTNLS